MSLWKKRLYLIITPTVFAFIGVGVGMNIRSCQTIEDESPQKNNFGSCFFTDNKTDLLLGTIDDQAIILAALPEDVQEAHARIEAKRFQQQSDLFMELAVRLELNKNEDIPLAKLPKLKDMPQHIVSDIEVKEFFEKNKSSFTSSNLAEVNVTLRNHLQQQKIGVTVAKTAATMTAGRVKFALTFPCGRKIDVVPPGENQPQQAPLNLIVVTDFQCTPCRRIGDYLVKLAANNPNKINLQEIFIAATAGGTGDFLARGHYCAQAQGDKDKLAAYRTNAYFSQIRYDSAGKPIEPTNPQTPALETARRTGLDMVDFSKCLDSKDAETFLAQNLEFAASAGAENLPFFLLNSYQLIAPFQFKETEIIQRILSEMQQ